MQFKNFVTGFVRQWNFTRSETLEILESLTDEQLNFKPKEMPTTLLKEREWQTLGYQFGCILRTQLVYTRAIREVKMDYSWFHDPQLMDKNQFKKVKDLQLALEKANQDWLEAIRTKRRDEEFKISWPGFKTFIPNHITALIAHERIHHGQLITYLTLAGIEFPKNFKANWAL